MNDALHVSPSAQIFKADVFTETWVQFGSDAFKRTFTLLYFFLLTSTNFIFKHL